MSAILRVDNISRDFGGIKAVDSVSFEVKQGSILGVIGPNGAGKTVLLNLINGVYKTREGGIFFEGRAIHGLRSDQIARLGIGRTFQSTEQFSEVRAIDYVMLGGILGQYVSVVACTLGLRPVRRRERADRARALTMLERFGLHGVANERMFELPYGVQKQIDLARALLGEPRLLLLDEPTSGTTSVERAAIGEIIEEIGGGDRTLVIVDHDVRFLSKPCETLVAMSNGRKIADGSVTEVLTDKAVREAYLGLSEAAATPEDELLHPAK
jgi:branched-chain amino acid transport system ATP-binding protein